MNTQCSLSEYEVDLARRLRTFILPNPRPQWPSAEFYDELVAHAVPIDLRALKALKGSPVALDIYSWLTYRMSYLRKPCPISWEALQTQFGADYGRLRDFKRRFLRHLGAVLQVYPSARIRVISTFVTMRPSSPQMRLT